MLSPDRDRSHASVPGPRPIASTPRSGADRTQALGPAADTAAAAILDGCGEAPCGYGAALVSNARSLLLLYDGDADRALADDPARRVIFQNYSVFVADAGFFDAATLAAIDAYYAGLPPRLLSTGTLGVGTPDETAFCTMTCKNAFKCGDDAAPGTIVSFTKIGFNVFAEQLAVRPPTTGLG